MADIFTGLVRSMSGFNDTSVFITGAQRKRMQWSMIEAYYADLPEGTVGFDAKGNMYTQVEVLTGRDGFVKCAEESSAGLVRVVCGPIDCCAL